ncbi:MAG: biotin/lipoyl-containing protein [Candidatus Omnitrophota bacterium]
MKVVLPEIGEGVIEATVSFWHVDEGAKVNEGDDLVEMITDKATFNVPAPTGGILKEILCKEGEMAKVGKTIAVIETKGE